MSTETEPIPAAGVRSLQRWGVPFHYVVPAAVAMVGLLLLAGGGAVAIAGAWWLVVALPIAIGSLFQDPRLAASPVVVWVLWLIIAAIAGGDSGVAHTPVALAIALGALGAVATRVAQFAIFPATAREAWAPTIHRLAGSGDGVADAGPETPADDDEPTLPELDMTQMTVTIDAIEPIGTAEHAELSETAAELGEHAELIETAAEVELLAAAAKVEAAAKGDTTAQPKPRDDAAANPESAPDDTNGGAPAPQPKVVHVELPMDADPAPLDEGGHVTEFRAITDADVLAAEQGQPGSDVP